MNKPHIRFHLTEARQALDQLLTELDRNLEYEFGDYRVDIEHLFHHIISAWNGRDASEQATSECSEGDFRRWRQFPADIELIS